MINQADAPPEAGGKVKKVFVYLLAYAAAYFVMCGLVYAYFAPTFLSGAFSVLVATAAGELAASSIASEFMTYYRMHRAYGGRIKSAWVALKCAVE